MKHLIAIGFVLLTLTGFSQYNSNKVHKIEVVEVLQTDSYTYLLGREDGSEMWIAIPKLDAKVGEFYYYQKGNIMRDFKSTQLDRTFDSLLFLGGVVNAKEVNDDMGGNMTLETKNGKASKQKLTLDLSPAQGGITVSELFAKPEKYEGKIVKIRGKITQYNKSIMGRNWIHMQDGTEFEGQFDLIATSKMTAQTGDIITVEGTVTLNKDFGYGYFYKVLLENCTVAFE